MSTEVEALQGTSLPIPPSYEQCVASPAAPRLVDLRANYVASPLAIAALWAWDDEDDELVLD